MKTDLLQDLLQSPLYRSNAAFRSITDGLVRLAEDAAPVGAPVAPATASPAAPPVGAAPANGTPPAAAAAVPEMTDEQVDQWILANKGKVSKLLKSVPATSSIFEAVESAAEIVKQAHASALLQARFRADVKGTKPPEDDEVQPVFKLKEILSNPKNNMLPQLAASYQSMMVHPLAKALLTPAIPLLEAIRKKQASSNVVKIDQQIKAQVAKAVAEQMASTPNAGQSINERISMAMKKPEVLEALHSITKLRSRKKGTQSAMAELIQDVYRIALDSGVPPKSKKSESADLFYRFAAGLETYFDQIRQVVRDSFAQQAQKSKAPTSAPASGPTMNPADFTAGWDDGAKQARTSMETVYTKLGFKADFGNKDKAYATFMNDVATKLAQHDLKNFKSKDLVATFAKNVGELWWMRPLPWIREAAEQPKMESIAKEAGDGTDQKSALTGIWAKWSDAPCLAELAKNWGIISDEDRAIYRDILAAVNQPVNAFFDSLTSANPSVVPYLAKMKTKFSDFNHVNSVYKEMVQEIQNSQSKSWYDKIKSKMSPPSSDLGIVNAGSMSRANKLIEIIGHNIRDHRDDKDFIQKAVVLIMNAIHDWNANSKGEQKKKHLDPMETTAIPAQLGTTAAASPTTSLPASTPTPESVTPASVPTPPPPSDADSTIVAPERTPASTPTETVQSSGNPLDFDWLTVGLASAVFHALQAKEIDQ